MKRLIVLFLSFHIVLSPAFAQDSSSSSGKLPSPYSTNWVDGAVIGAGIGLTYLGVKLINDKKDITIQELASIKRENIPFFDRGNAGFYSRSADDASYIPFHVSFAMPVLFSLINKNERSHIGQVLMLYTETMAITGTLFTMATGNVYRTRPYVYGDKVDMAMKLDNDSHRSFYAGHTAASAAASFYAAKVFADMNPTSKAKPYIWGVAAALPAVTGYLRYKAGMHFLSDNLLGYVLGAGAGILVPQLHKRKKFKEVSVVPFMNDYSRGLALTYNIK